LPPRAIVHATWGPVQASVTTRLTSSTFPFAISPALLSETLTFQQPPCASNPHFEESLSYVADVVRRLGG
jgi:hypothetical protein